MVTGRLKPIKAKLKAKTKTKKQAEAAREAEREHWWLLVPDVAGSESGHQFSHHATAVDVRYISQNATITRHN